MRQIFIFGLILTCGTSYKDKDYIINTSKCKIPNIQPFNKEVVDIMNPQSYLSCNRSELLTFVSKTENNSAVLYLREDLIPLYTLKNISCCYSYVTRNGWPDEPDVGIEISQCFHFDQHVILTHDIVKVTCTEKYNDSYIVYENVHNPITVKNSIKKKLRSFNDTSKPFSVLFIVVDSISRLNFIRTMPATYEFLKENNFIEMKGYTKVADNTYPNFVSLLTGLTWNEMIKRCKSKKVGGLDKCPMIWYDYRQEGYITAYAEDNSPISTFNYQKKGFKYEPTDYYFKPYIEASETLNIAYNNYMPYCTGPETAGERILNLAKDFATTFKHQSTFGVFWMNTFSHDDINAPYAMDEKMKQFFKDIKNEGILNESIVFFLSDHGIRFGEIVETQSGWFEERMPVNMISLPKKFQEKFSEEYHNLKKNEKKLTSTYDMFMTLQHILTLSGISSENKTSSACPKCTSLFKKIPLNRSCRDAGIPSQWCTCIGYFQEINKTEEYVQNATTLAMEKINSRSASSSEESETYILEEIVLSSISKSVGPKRNTKYLFIVLKTLPEQTFLVTVQFQDNVTNNSIFYIR